MIVLEKIQNLVANDPPEGKNLTGIWSKGIVFPSAPLSKFLVSSSPSISPERICRIWPRGNLVVVGGGATGGRACRPPDGERARLTYVPANAGDYVSGRLAGIASLIKRTLSNGRKGSRLPACALAADP